MDVIYAFRPSNFLKIDIHHVVVILLVQEVIG